jgi:membrane protein DedA with SNARE-associated domain
MLAWVSQLMSSLGYAALVFLMFVENVFPPIPSELIMPLAGFVSTQGGLSLAGVIAAGTLGSVLGALPLYYLGRRLGAERLKTLADRHGRWLTVCGGDIERAIGWFDRHGRAAVFFGRLVPGVRSLISLPAGIDRMPVVSFLLFTALGSGIWSALLAYAGFLLGGRYQEVERYVNPVSYVVLGAMLAVYLWRVATHRGRSAG